MPEEILDCPDVILDFLGERQGCTGIVELTVRVAKQVGWVGHSGHFEAIFSPEVGHQHLRIGRNTSRVEDIFSPGS
jgi:hypothetical protein